jgi:hypothetical protein
MRAERRGRMILPKGWINLKREEFMPEARSCVAAGVAVVDQPAWGGIDD